MSSRFIPPNVGEIFAQISTNLSISSSLTSMSNTSTSAKTLKSNPLPSITGFPAKAPIFPSPSTAVPFDITATRFPLEVYL